MRPHRERGWWCGVRGKCLDWILEVRPRSSPGQRVGRGHSTRTGGSVGGSGSVGLLSCCEEVCLEQTRMVG